MTNTFAESTPSIPKNLPAGWLYADASGHITPVTMTDASPEDGSNIEFPKKSQANAADFLEKEFPKYAKDWELVKLLAEGEEEWIKNI